VTFERAVGLALGGPAMLEIGAAKLADGGFPRTAARLRKVAAELADIRETVCDDYDPTRPGHQVSVAGAPK